MIRANSEALCERAKTGIRDFVFLGCLVCVARGGRTYVVARVVHGVYSSRYCCIKRCVACLPAHENVQYVKFSVDVQQGRWGEGEKEREKANHLRKLTLQLKNDRLRWPQDEEGRTPLHFAVDRGQPAVISRLLELGSEVDARDIEGMTPLAYAVACEHEKEIELLVRVYRTEANTKNSLTTVFAARSNLFSDRLYLGKHPPTADVLFWRGGKFCADGVVLDRSLGETVKPGSWPSLFWSQCMDCPLSVYGHHCGYGNRGGGKVSPVVPVKGREEVRCLQKRWQDLPS